MMDLDALREAVEQVRFGIEHHGGVFNEDLKVLDGVDPQAWSLIEDYIDRVVAAARAVLHSEEAWECGTYSTVHFDEHLDDNGSCSHCRSAAVMAGCGPVFVVRLLAEEKTPRFDPMSDPTFDPDHVTPGGSP